MAMGIGFQYGRGIYLTKFMSLAMGPRSQRISDIGLPILHACRIVCSFTVPESYNSTAFNSKLAARPKLHPLMVLWNCEELAQTDRSYNVRLQPIEMIPLLKTNIT